MRDFKLGIATREAYGKALLELGRKNNQIVVLDGDLSKSTYTSLFGKAFPDRFFNVGIAEANMVSIAAGLASFGKIPFVSTFAVFVMCKAFDQLRMCVAYPSANVKIVASHGGISIGEDGPSQQSVEDIALACSLPGFTVIVPADEVATWELVQEAANYTGPVYIRVGRPKTPLIYEKSEKFPLGKSKTLQEGEDITVIANGLMVSEALLAADICQTKGLRVRVIDMYTVKPIDEDVIVAAAKETGAIVTVEEHLVTGGLGSMVAQVIGRTLPIPMEFVGIQNTYAESGTPQQLLQKYGLTATHIVQAIERVLARKKALIAY